MKNLPLCLIFKGNWNRFIELASCHCKPAALMLRTWGGSTECKKRLSEFFTHFWKQYVGQTAVQFFTLMITPRSSTYVMEGICSRLMFHHSWFLDNWILQHAEMHSCFYVFAICNVFLVLWLRMLFPCLTKERVWWNGDFQVFNMKVFRRNVVLTHNIQRLSLLKRR